MSAQGHKGAHRESSDDTRLGLALGGGGARGVAHIGVLKVLHHAGIVPDQVAGTSAGAIIGAMYASGAEPQWIEQRFRQFLESAAFKALRTRRIARRFDDPESISPFSRRLQDHMVLNLALHREAIIPRERLRAALEFLVPVSSFEELAIPLRVCAVDVSQCELVVHEEGDLIEALCDSAAIPGVIEARRDGAQIIADGGMFAPIPVDQLDCEFKIVSDVSLRGLPNLGEVNIYRLMMRAERLTQMALAAQLATRADFVLSPDVGSLHWSQFSQFDALLEAGAAEAQSKLAALKAAMEKRKQRSWWRQILSVLGR